MAQSYSWIVGSGAWSTPADWADVTTSTNPSLTAPGTADAATIQGPTISSPDIISGPGSAASLSLLNFVALAGTFTAASASFSTTTSGTVNILADAVLNTGSAVATSQTLSVNGAGAELLDSGTLSAQGFDEIEVANGGFLRAGLLALTGEIGVDPTGTVEIGDAGGAPAGTISVDAGATVQSGQFVAPVLVNGLINGNGEGFNGAVTGTGTISVAGSARFEAPVAAGVNVVFPDFGSGGDLTLAEPATFHATIAGTRPGDLIAVNEPGVTSLAYSGTASGGTLALLGGAATLDSLLFAGSYDPGSFLLLPFGGAFANANIAVATNGPTTPAAAPAGPGGRDSYNWGTTTGGAWNNAANWGGLAPPGSSNPVTIASAINGYQVINGDGDSESILFTGQAALNGVFNTGTLTVHITLALTPSTLALLPGSVLNATAVDLSSGMDVGGATLAVSGTLGFGDSSLGSGSLFVYGGGLVHAAALTLGIAGSYASVSIDPTSTMEIGSAGGAAAGALTVDAGATADIAGEIDGNVVNNGLMRADTTEFGIPSVLNGAISDTGTIAMAAGTGLTLKGNVTGGGSIDFAAGSTLTIQTPGTLDALLGGFALGDTIGTGSTEVAGALFTPATGALVLTDASANPLVTLDMGGSFSGDTFLPVNSATVFGADSSVVLAAGTVQNGAPPAPSAGTAGADDYTWTATGGAWGDAADWSDVTAGQTVAAVAPGSVDLVTIPDLAISGAWQVISGAGNAASLTVLGNAALSGAFATQALVVTAGDAAGGNGGGIGSLDVLAGATLAVAAASITGALLAEGAGALIDIGGLLTLNGAVSATGQADVVAAGLTSANGAAVYIDPSAIMEIGAAGGAVAGALNIDAGLLVNVKSLGLTGNLVNNGTLAISANGDFSLAGNVSGNGVLALNGGFSELNGSIGAGQTVALSGTDNSLRLGSLAAPTIMGFAPGDSITFQQEITGASWSAGVLTLTTDGMVVESIPLAGDFAPDTFIVTPQPVIPGNGKAAVAPAGGVPGEAVLTLVPCFATGTSIATTEGPVPVERLRAGDRVLSAFGGVAAVLWIGHRTLDCRRHPRPAEVLPVRVRAGAFGAAMPSADLVLSPDHAVFVEGALVPIRHLINGASVAREPAAEVTYWHVELPAHGVIFAEGLPAESYLDTGNRSAFAEAAEPLAQSAARGSAV